MFAESLPTASPSAQTWAAIATALAGAVAVFVKKRYNRSRPRPPIEIRKSKIENDSVTRTELHQSLDSVANKVDANHKEVLTVLANQGAIIEHRLDRLDTIVARLDERTKS